MEKKLFFVAAVFLNFTFLSCERDTKLYQTEDEEVINDEGNAESHDNSDDYTWDNTSEIPVLLNDNSIVCNAIGVSIDESTLTITSAGTYNISGSLSNGQIIVDTEDEDIVRLLLNGVTITCSYNSPIYVRNAEKTMIVLQEGTQNYLTDGITYTYAESDDDSNASIYSKDDLTIYGKGSLTVAGNFNDGITSKDGLIIESDLITVNAVDDGIRGKDYLIIKDIELTVICGGDGLKSDNDEDSSKGYISIETGTFTITADGDAVSAETDVLIAYCEMNIISGNGSTGSVYSTTSMKGIKANEIISIDNGIFTINSTDDAIHSNGSITINEGTFEIASGDDGIHADADLDIIGGYINISKSYEGLESAQGNINIYEGEIFVISSDDGVNVSAGSNSNRPGGTKSSTSYSLNIYGGYIAINSKGDGLDSNGAITISGGTIIVSSSELSDNNAIDYDGSCVVSGGLIIASGTSRMNQAPSTSSSQYSVSITFSSTQKAGRMIHIESTDGSQILTVKPKKSFQSLVVSSPDLKKGTTYNIYQDGSSTGSEENGLYTNGTYTAGSKYSSFSISSMVTYVN
ncbi:carbohydrate-binding domain-containing protein [Labilibaculum manganireducens]|nr:carbohydrate-binding domain-containing protein [Labilibaculum manganireducens]